MPLLSSILIGAGISTFIGTALHAIFSDDDTGSSSSSHTSDESEATLEAILEEKLNAADAAAGRMRRKINYELKKIKNLCDENQSGTAELSCMPDFAEHLRSLIADENFNIESDPQIFFYPAELPPSSLNRKLEEVSKLLRKLQKDLPLIRQDLGVVVNSREIDSDVKRDLEKLCGEKAVSELQKYLNVSCETKPRMVATGLLKAGKSTLLNCLTEDVSNSRFKTGVVRKTVREQMYSDEQFIYVDTPGIDAQEEDSLSAHESLKAADIVLFTHNMNGGGLDEPEREFLVRIAKNWEKPDEFVKKTIVVLTHLDKAELCCQTVHGEIEKQFVAIFGKKPEIISVSSSRYIKGISEGKNLLAHKSNYETLKGQIESMKSRVMGQKRTRYLGKAYVAAESIIDRLQTVRQECKAQIRTRKEAFCQMQEYVEQAVEKSNEALKAAYENYFNTLNKILEE